MWTFVINGNPPQTGISVEDVHVALGLIKVHKECVLNVPTAGMIKPFDRVDMNSTKVMNKFELSGLTADRAKSVNAPVIRESSIHIECKVLYELRVPPIRTVFIAEVTATSVLPWCM